MFETSEIKRASTVVLSTAYLGSVQYYSKIATHDNILIEKHENYTRQTYRNRCVIYGANGALPLVIPVKKKSSQKTVISDIKIDYSTNWQKMHLRSIESAYGSSPFYQYYIDDLLPFYLKEYLFLIDFNNFMLETILKILKIESRIEYTKKFIKTFDNVIEDCRYSIAPGKHPGNEIFFPLRYYQVFAEKFGFIPGLSIVDLLFNSGQEANILLNRQGSINPSL